MQIPGIIARAAIGVALLVSTPIFRAQDTVSISDPAEFNAYSAAVSQNDPRAKAAGLESFLTAYPQSVVKKVALDTLLGTYTSMGDSARALNAAARLLQLDPNNLKAIYVSVYIQKTQCEKNQDAQSCNDAAALAQKGLVAMRGAGVSDADWERQTAAAYPLFRSVIAKAGATEQPKSTVTTQPGQGNPPAFSSQPATARQSSTSNAAPPQGVVTVGQLISKVAPIYPPIAKAAHVQGTVVIKAVIWKDGSVNSPTVVSGPPMLQQAAIDAVRQWKYQPYTLNGAPVEVETTLNIGFALDGGEPQNNSQSAQPAQTTATQQTGVNNSGVAATPQNSVEGQGQQQNTAVVVPSAHSVIEEYRNSLKEPPPPDIELAQSKEQSHVPSSLWTDPTTSLMWTMKDNGREVDREQAIAYCFSLRLGGYSTWRLPTDKELSSIWDSSSDIYAHDWRLKGGIEFHGNAWSSTPGKDSGEIWDVSPETVGSYLIDSRVLCVRNSGTHNSSNASSSNAHQELKCPGCMTIKVINAHWVNLTITDENGYKHTLYPALQRVTAIVEKYGVDSQPTALFNFVSPWAQIMSQGSTLDLLCIGTQRDGVFSPTCPVLAVGSVHDTPLMGAEYPVNLQQQYADGSYVGWQVLEVCHGSECAQISTINDRPTGAWR